MENFPAEQKITEIDNALKDFILQLGDPDIYSQTLLEVLFEELYSNSLDESYWLTIQDLEK